MDTNGQKEKLKFAPPLARGNSHSKSTEVSKQTKKLVGVKCSQGECDVEMGHSQDDNDVGERGREAEMTSGKVSKSTEVIVKDGSLSEKERIKNTMEGRKGLGESLGVFRSDEGHPLEQECQTQTILQNKRVGTGSKKIQGEVKRELKRGDLRMEIKGVQGSKDEKAKERSGKMERKEKKKVENMDSENAREETAPGPKQGTEKPREENGNNRKVSCVSSTMLSDRQYNDIFDSVLDSSLEHCLEDAKTVLSEVELLQARVDNGYHSENRWKKHKSSLSNTARVRAIKGRETPVLEKSEEAGRDNHNTKGKRRYEESEDEDATTSKDEYDLWVQCNKTSCMKWRRLSQDVDPSTLPSDWTCSQSTDPECNSCKCPEETWKGGDGNLVHSHLVPGSMVWAQQNGFPWWPAVIEKDPDCKSSFLFKNSWDKSPSKYHVTYFGDPVTRAWVSACKVKDFQAFSEETALNTKNTYKKKLCEALQMAEQAQKLPIKMRLSHFGFRSRYFVDRESPVGESSIADLEMKGMFLLQKGKMRRRGYSCNKDALDKKKRSRHEVQKKDGKKEKLRDKEENAEGSKEKTGKHGPTTISHGKQLKKAEGEGAEKKRKLLTSSFTGVEEGGKATDKPAPKLEKGTQSSGRDQMVPEKAAVGQGEREDCSGEVDQGKAGDNGCEKQAETCKSEQENEEVKRESNKEGTKSKEKVVKREKRKREVKIESGGLREIKDKNEWQRVEICKRIEAPGLGLEESEEELLKEDMEILSYQQDVLKRLASDVEEEVDLSFMLFGEE